MTLSNPFTNRAQTIQTIASVLLGAGSLALIVAIIAVARARPAADDADPAPHRRLPAPSRTATSMSRVSAPASGSPEVAELATAFNHMADRLQESIDVISQDRDRSRAFLADVSHELRTPIAALRTFNELLRDGAGEDPETRDEFLEQSGRQIERLDWLATNLLELSKLDSGLIALDLRPDDLRAVVENAIEQAQPVADAQGRRRCACTSPTRRCASRTTRRASARCSRNLIGNAIKFTPKGGRVDVDLEADRRWRRAHRDRHRRRHSRRRAAARVRALLPRGPPAGGARQRLRPRTRDREVDRGHARRPHHHPDGARRRNAGDGDATAPRDGFLHRPIPAVEFHVSACVSRVRAAGSDPSPTSNAAPSTWTGVAA